MQEIHERRGDHCHQCSKARCELIPWPCPVVRGEPLSMQSQIEWCIGMASGHDYSVQHVRAAQAELERLQRIAAVALAVVEAWDEGETPTTEIRALSRTFLVSE